MHQLPTHLRRRRTAAASSRPGAVAVEFAIVAPLFFLIVLTLFEFARLKVIRHTMDNAAYEAARVAIVPGATAAEALAQANSLLNMVGTRGATVNINPAVLDASVQQVTVTVDVPLLPNALVVPKFTGSTTLRSTATMITERVQNP